MKWRLMAKSRSKKMKGDPKLVEIDLAKADDDEHPDIKKGVFYLALIEGAYYAGKFSRQWYGWNFESVYDAGYQLSYGIDRLWEIVP
jgi:hypothetical protein